ncbi:MAG: hypothetical protein LBG15_07870 [Dysgonamonadaceae bacterium]|jgi:hypothetical protein|nr:hypothetical protein [Dysgonamonadaceae bacterium]
MSKIICDAVDFVFIHEINDMNPEGVPILEEGKSWKKIIPVEKPVYQSVIKQNDAGPTNEETITVKARCSNLTGLLVKYCGFHLILRISTDEKIFYVGTLEYPCIMEYTCDKVFDNFTFRAISST